MGKDEAAKRRESVTTAGSRWICLDRSWVEVGIRRMNDDPVIWRRTGTIGGDQSNVVLLSVS